LPHIKSRFKIFVFLLTLLRRNEKCMRLLVGKRDEKSPFSRPRIGYRIIITNVQDLNISFLC
jgi:hypothetical protein